MRVATDLVAGSMPWEMGDVMSLFGDFVHFLSSLALGKKDASQSFLEPLTMAERYLRWGQERGDIRDYMSSLTQLDLADDENAPKAEMIVRKYSLYQEATVGAIQVMLKKHRELAGQAKETHSELLADQQSLASHIKASQEKIKELKDDGSLISAKEEERRLEELKLKMAAVTRDLDVGEISPEVMSSYDDLAREADRLLGNLDQAVMNLEMAASVPPDVVGQVRTQISTKLDAVRQELNAANPTAASAV